jgi:hypothetical protein
MIEDILAQETKMMMDKKIMAGGISAMAAYFIAQKMELGVVPTLLSIGGSHFIGHSLAELYLGSDDDQPGCSC